MPISNASQWGNIPPSVTWNDIQFNAKKTQCDRLLNKRPCEDFPGLPVFKTSDLDQMIDAFPNTVNRRPLISSKAKYERFTASKLPLKTSDPIPASLQNIFDQIQKCAMGSTSPFIPFVMAEESLELPIANTYTNEVMVARKLQTQIQSLDLSEEEKTSLTYFIYAHELSHFIVDLYARDDKFKHTASGNRPAYEIQEDYFNTRGSQVYRDEYHLQHYEVDRVAQQLLKRCHLPSPSYEPLVTLMSKYEEKEKDPSQCTLPHKRAEVLLRANKGL